MSTAAQLEAYILGRKHDRFDWAVHNCCHFVAGWMRAATGADPMAGLPFTHGARAARRLVQQLGGSLEAAWSRQLGRAPIAPALAQTGDNVLLPAGTLAGAGGAVGLCTGRHVALVSEAHGVILLPMTHATHAWRLREAGAAVVKNCLTARAEAAA